MLPIHHPENIRRVAFENAAAIRCARNAAARTARIEREVSAFEAAIIRRRGFAARAWAFGADMGAGLACAALTLGCAIAQIGGAL